MSNKYQRKVNKIVRLFNKGFKKDIEPYNMFHIKQSNADISIQSPYDSIYLLHLYKGDKLVSQKWLDYTDIVGLGFSVIGPRMFWWVNNEVSREVHNEETA